MLILSQKPPTREACTVDPNHLCLFPPPGTALNRTLKNSVIYAKACVTLAQDLDVKVIDIWTAMQKEEVRDARKKVTPFLKSTCPMAKITPRPPCL